MTWYCYIVQCNDGSLYTGMTSDLYRRLLEHNSSKRGSKYTSYRRPVLMVYNEQLKTRSLALKRENEIKKWSREKKLKLVKMGQTGSANRRRLTGSERIHIRDLQK